MKDIISRQSADLRRHSEQNIKNQCHKHAYFFKEHQVFLLIWQTSGHCEQARVALFGLTIPEWTFAVFTLQAILSVGDIFVPRIKKGG